MVHFRLQNESDSWLDPESIGVLLILYSGGIESSVLLGEAFSAGVVPVPVYVATGTRWEETEITKAMNYLDAVRSDESVQLRIVQEKQAIDHWAYRIDLPAGKSVDELEIPGRNMLLLTTAALVPADNDKITIAIGTTKDNPFEDGTAEFMVTAGNLLSEDLGKEISIIAPFLNMSKQEIVYRGRKFPLELTISCISPVMGVQCGVCIKCKARTEALKPIKRKASL